MSEPFSVSCPKCKAKLRLKSQAAVGKKIACPKCTQPFVVKPPKVEAEEQFSFLDVSEPDDPDDELPEDGEAEEVVETPRSKGVGRRTAGASSGRVGKAKKGKSKPIEWQKPLLIGGLALLLLGGLGGLGYVAMSFLRGSEPSNKFDTVFLPPDAETFVQVRPAEMLAAPLMNSTLQHPAIKPNMDFLLPMAEGMLGIKLADIDTVTIGLPASFEFNQQSINALGAGQIDSVIVIKTKQPSSAATRQAGSGFDAATVSGKTVYRPKSGSVSYLVWMADDLRTVIAPESQIQRLLTQGKTLKRRPELDFVANDKHIAFAYIPADRAKLDRMTSSLSLPSSLGQAGGGMPGMPGGGMPAGGMPGGGMPGGGPAGASSNPLTGKVTGMAITLHVTSDLLIDTQNPCVDSASATSLTAEMKSSMQQAKDAFKQQKTQLQLMASMVSAGEFVPILDDIVNSGDVSSEGVVLTQRMKIPGSLKTAVENFINSEFFKTLVRNQGQGGGGGPPGFPFDPSKILGGISGFVPGVGGGGAPASLGGAQQPPADDDDGGFGSGTPPSGASPVPPRGLPGGSSGSPPGFPGATPGAPGASPPGGLRIGQPPGPAAGGVNPQAPPGVAP